MTQVQRSRSVAIVPAAGQGTRMGSETKKQFLMLGGEPLLVHTLRVLEDCPEVSSIILVVPEEERTFCEEQVLGTGSFVKIEALVPGGKERQDSVYAGLQALGDPPDVVVIHDGVRPFVTAEMVRETISFAAQGVSAIVGVPVSDTIKYVDATRSVMETLDRDRLWSIQTPQAFPYRELVTAYEEAYEKGLYGTDDASLMERLGLPVRVLMGSYENIKITSPADLVLGEAILKQRNTIESGKCE